MPYSHTANGTPDSVWSRMSKQQFFKPVDGLEKSQKVAGPSCIHQRDRRQDEPEHPLSAKVEQQLAEDLAFLAATEAGARAVTAATVHEAKNSLVIHLAANSGLAPSVQVQFEAILAQLSQCAREQVTKADAELSIFSSIIRLDRLRILSRLRPRFHRRQKWDAPEKGPLHEAVSRARKALANANRRLEAVHTLDKQIQRFLNCAQALDFCTLEDQDRQLQDVLEAACKIGDRVASLETMLGSKQISIPDAYIPTIQELDKVRRYACISKRLVSLASRHRFGTLFESASVVCLDSYNSQIVNHRERFVHAEVQLATYHRIHPSERPPRCIGTSKIACYLCNLFLCQHKQYIAPATHGVVYEKWIVPDILDYTQEHRLELRKILAQMHDAIKIARRQAPSKRPFPNQSVMFYTPCSSVTTLVPAEVDARADLSAVIEIAAPAPLLHAVGENPSGSTASNSPQHEGSAAIMDKIEEEPDNVEPADDVEFCNKNEPKKDEGKEKLVHAELDGQPRDTAIGVEAVVELKRPPNGSPSHGESASQSDSQASVELLQLSRQHKDQATMSMLDPPQAEDDVVSQRSLSPTPPDNKPVRGSADRTVFTLKGTAKRPSKASLRRRHKRPRNKRPTRRRHQRVAARTRRRESRLSELVSRGFRVLRKLFCFG